MSRRGQSLIEYGILILVAATSILFFFSFIRSAMSHRMKSGSDAFGHGMVYNP